MGSSVDSRPHPAKTVIPPCRGLGSQCRGVPVTLRVGPLEEGTTSLDHEATWLIGHTQNISFYDLWEDEGELYVVDYRGTVFQMGVPTVRRRATRG